MRAAESCAAVEEVGLDERLGGVRRGENISERRQFHPVLCVGCGACGGEGHFVGGCGKWWSCGVSPVRSCA